MINPAIRQACCSECFAFAEGLPEAILARLQPKEEVLLLGWGVPMPLPVRSRRYDDAFWKELFGKKAGGGGRTEKEIKGDMGF